MAKTGAARPATAEQLARFGHIAAVLRQALEQRGWKPFDLNEALGKERGWGAVYNWLNGKGSPSGAMRPVVAKVLGVDETDLMARKADGVTQEPTAHEGGFTHRQTSMAPTVMYGSVGVPVPMPRMIEGTDVLQVGLSGDGQMRIRLTVTLSAAAGWNLLETLRKAGLVAEK